MSSHTCSVRAIISARHGVRGDVRSCGQSGNHLLVLSFSHFDPDVWSGRALQEVFVDLVVSGLASMYPVSSWSCFAPDHHGYQRA